MTPAAAVVAPAPVVEAFPIRLFCGVIEVEVIGPIAGAAEHEKFGRLMRVRRTDRPCPDDFVAWEKELMREDVVE